MKKTKKMLSILFVVGFLLLSGVIATSAESVYSLGDVNASGDITAADARLILRHSAMLEDFTDEQKEAADIDSNGDVTAGDARIALRISASLEDIKDYIVATPDDDGTVEVPDNENPDDNESGTQTDVKELSNYLCCSVDELVEAGIDVTFVEEYYDWSTDGFTIFVDWYDYDYDDVIDETQIYWIAIEEPSDYTIYGVKYGMTVDEALQVLADNGIEATLDEIGDIYIADYENGIYLYMYTYDGETLSSLNVHYEAIDVWYGLGYNIDYYFYIMPDLVLVDEENNIYANDYVELYVTEYGYVDSLVLNSSISTVTACGIYAGMTSEQVDELLEWFGFIKTEDYYINEYYNECLYVSYDADGLVESVEFSRGAYSDLTMYIIEDTNKILNDFDLVQDETGYGSDAIHFGLNAGGDYVTEVQINGDCDHSIFDLTFGMNLDAAIEELSYYGYDIEVNERCYYYDDTEYFELCSEDGVTVSSITYGIVTEEY